MSPSNLPDENTAYPREGADQADGQPSLSAPDVFPLFEIIDEFVAQHPVLQELSTPQNTRWYLVSDNERNVNRHSELWDIRSGTARLRKYIDDLDPQDHAVLIVEDINAELYHTLCARYSSSIDAEFLAQHVLRLADLRGTFNFDNDDFGRAFFKLGSHVRATLSRTYSGPPDGQHLRGHHIFGEIEPQLVSKMRTCWEPGPGYRSETFKK
jgi:hypothetical protein